MPPVITPLNVRSAADMRSTSAVNFRITDNLSGISAYTGTIDGQWALFEYDAKNSLLFYRFDAGRVQKNTTHTLELRVTDGKGNTAVYSTTFTW